jgi:hypothetical protein
MEEGGVGQTLIRVSDRPSIEEFPMRRLWNRPERIFWSLVLALAVVLMPSGTAHAQYFGYDAGYGGYPGWGYGYPGVGFGFPGLGYGYSGAGYAMPGWGFGYPGFGFGGFGFGYGGFGYPFFGYGLGPGLTYPGPVYGFGYPGVGYAGSYASSVWNPMVGAGVTPLAAQSYMLETQVFGRIPRTSAAYYGAASRRLGY